MSVIVKQDNVDISSLIDWGSLEVRQELTNKRDSANFLIRNFGNKSFTPTYGSVIEVWDGADKIFGGRLVNFTETAIKGGVIYEISASDYSIDLDKHLVSETYRNTTIKDIIIDFISNNEPSFNTDNVQGNIEIDKVVFNQKPITECIRILADYIRYDWYVDANKNVYFFAKGYNSAPYNLTDTSGNYIYESLKRSVDGSQIVNTVKVRGGKYESDEYTDYITVSGNNSKSFKLPYQMTGLEVWIDTGSGYTSQTVGVDFIDDFTTKDVLHNFQEQTIKWENALTSGDVIKFTGKPKVRVFAIAVDDKSKAKYGEIEKLIRDNNIEDNLTAKKRARAELKVYADKAIDASFKTYNKGIRAGQVINLNSTIRDCEHSLLVKSVKFTMLDPNTFGYYVSLVDTKRIELSDILRKLLEPEKSEIEEVEVSEEIFGYSENFAIIENIETVAPKAFQANIEIDENIVDNSGTAVEFVLEEYNITGITDTKREGRLDISLIAY